MPLRATETPHRFMSILGLVASGDLGGLTCYRDRRGRVVFFSKSYPAPNVSLAILTGRARMYFGAEQWRNFSDYQQQRWRDTVNALSLNMTGYNLWQIWWHNPDKFFFDTVEHQTGINTLLCITRVPPAIPPPAKFEPHETDDPSSFGRLRYGRKRVVMPHSTTEWLPFLCHHADFPDGEPIPTWFTIYGHGTLGYPPTVQNNKWTCIAYTSPAFYAWTVLEMESTWPDASTDKCRVDIFTRNF